MSAMPVLQLTQTRDRPIAAVCKQKRGIGLLSSFLVLLLQVSAAAPVASEPPVQDAAIESPAADAVAETPTPAALILPKGHAILIAIDGEVGSKVSTTGDIFPIRLAEPVVVDGVELLPAGITGEGQVVHAKKGGMAGAAGELLLAARYLDHGGRRIELRSFKFIEAGDQILTRGKDNIGLATATNIAVGPLGFFIGGGNTIIAPGTVATAKTRNDEAFERASDAPPSAPELTEEGMQ